MHGNFVMAQINRRKVCRLNVISMRLIFKLKVVVKI